jgi:hypothetical protein
MGRTGKNQGFVRIAGIGDLVAERGDDVSGQGRVISGSGGQDAAPGVPGGLIEQATVPGYPRAELG